jgi:hypothetical protein
MNSNLVRLFKKILLIGLLALGFLVLFDVLIVLYSELELEVIEDQVNIFVIIFEELLLSF